MDEGYRAEGYESGERWRHDLQNAERLNHVIVRLRALISEAVDELRRMGAEPPAVRLERRMNGVAT